MTAPSITAEVGRQRGGVENDPWNEAQRALQKAERRVSKLALGEGDPDDLVRLHWMLSGVLLRWSVMRLERANQPALKLATKATS